MDQQKNQYIIIKVLQTGYAKTGKTFLRLRQGWDKNLNQDPPLGVDFFNKRFQIEGQEVVFQFWDYRANEICYSLPATYYRNCSVLIILYDITNRQSFEKVFIFYNDFNFKRSNNLTTLFLVGNKCDLEEERQVSYQEGKQLSESLGMIFIEVSFKEDYQVNELFEVLMHKAFNIN